MSAERDAPPVGAQLFSLRREMEDDVESTLRRVADLGFLGVESVGFHGPFELFAISLLDGLAGFLAAPSSAVTKQRFRTGSGRTSRPFC